ncbi:MAG: (E)-4-hydroxy-3-methylbut-2-enyl-diphosphate synthase [Bacteroidales bacterium]|nr:(E)-4-hydroxy-3-methylbut-2-enyl-diphosphate synthase [Bacteroidales bacterium]
MDSFSLRRNTKTVSIGNISLGGNNPIRIQSMTNTNTMDTKNCCKQICELVDSGCELVRIATPDIKSAQNLYEIKNTLLKIGYNVPLIADVHYNPKVAEVAASLVEKVRINPGNYFDRPSNKKRWTYKEYNEELERISLRLLPLVETCKRFNCAIRVGTNFGSLSQRIVSKYGNTPIAMAISAMEFTKILDSLNFDQIVLSQKASNVQTMIQSTKLLCYLLDKENLNYPIHLGVTEAGDGNYGRIKSAIGIGTLLSLGIGDTIRVSLTENPEKEIAAAMDILQASGKRIFKAEIISCPSCGRTKYNIEEALQEVKKACEHLKGVKIGVMGCIVNGLGEMADADYGYIGSGKGIVNLYRKKDLIYKNIPQNKALEKLISMIKEDGKWIDL